MTAEPGLESNNDSGIVPNCSQGLTTTDESAENSDHENQISDKPSKVDTVQDFLIKLGIKSCALKMSIYH